MRNYKKLIKRLLYYSGIPYLFVKFLYSIGFCFCNTPSTLILCYHSINDLNNSKSVIEHKLKSSITGFSYPLGFSDNNVINILKEAGYKYAITTIPGVNNSDIDFFKLKRITAGNNFHLFKFRLICQSGTLYNIYSKLVRLLV